jgi:hypothetical protein
MYPYMNDIINLPHISYIDMNMYIKFFCIAIVFLYGYRFISYPEMYMYIKLPLFMAIDIYHIQKYICI